MVKLTDIQDHVQLAPHTTMQVGGACDYFVVAKNVRTVKEACDWATAEHVPIFVLGEGSNIVVSDDPLHKLVLKVELRGVEKVSENSDSVTLSIGAGEHWDDVVRRAVELELSGIEAMSAIPGTAGAAPVQNAGAYGQEVADTLVDVEAYDMLEQHFVTIPHADCGFEYRNSIFKTEAAGRYVITRVTLKLSKKPPAIPTYESLKRYLAEHHIEHATLPQIREGVMEVRKRILPDPSVVPNSGSFFKNPIVDVATLERLEKQFHKVPSYKYGDQYKLAAGWIVEQCGFKGSEHYGLKLWPNHALVITNPHNAGYADLM
ncbi:MAG TPA: UDP-N-acetylmuramate dehydrogenase, partial [Candidatus Saccharimonadia bacterium]|nr:UDP-N-acetylmuramate dehydrogenase [Candidatus Saccharimonadia bacterium]